MHVAIMDAMIGCWEAKYYYWTIRPYQASSFVSLALATPNHPSYPSGHSCGSASAARVLSRFFPDHEDELEQLVEEVGVPRIYAGDDLHENNFRMLLTHMMEDPRKITAGMDMLLVSGNLERIADMATNVAEEVVFLSKAGLSNTTPNGGTPVSFGDGECMRAYARDIRDSESGLRDLYESVR